MSDPVSHFVGGMIVAGTLGNTVSRVLLKEKRPKVITLAFVGGVVSALLDLDHLPRLIEAGWSVERMLTDNNLDTPGRLMHVSITVFFNFLGILLITTIPQKENKYRNAYSQIAIWVMVFGIAFITHLFMDYALYCVVTAWVCKWRLP